MKLYESIRKNLNESNLYDSISIDVINGIGINTLYFNLNKPMTEEEIHKYSEELQKKGYEGYEYGGGTKVPGIAEEVKKDELKGNTLSFNIEQNSLNESSYGNEYIVYVMEQTGTGSYQSKEVDRVYSEEQAEDRCAELRAETGCNTWYETVSSGSDDYEYDDGDTDWAAEEEADATERFENRYMGGGNGYTESEKLKEAEEWEKALDSGKVINVYDRSKHFAPAKFFKYKDKIYYNDDNFSWGNWFEHPQKGPKEMVEHIKWLLKNKDTDYDDVDYTVDILEEQPDILYNNDKEQTSIKLNDNVTTEIHNKEPDTARANNSIKEWYIKEYPKDTLGKEIPESLTFNDISNALDNHKDVYELLSPADDSIVRERVFAELADIMGVNYDYIYNKWLGESDSIHKYKVVVKHDKGKATLTTTASNKEAAIKNICNTEKCPESAVVKVTELKEMDNSNGLTNIKFEEYCKGKQGNLGTVDVKDLDGNTVQVKVAFEQPIRDYGNCKVLDSEDAMDKLGTDGETIEFVDEKGEYHNSPMVSPVTILGRLEFNKIDKDYYSSVIQYWNELKDLFESDKLNESYAIVEYWGNDWKSKEKVINGKTTKEVEKKVLKLADKNEVIATRQASADLKTSEVLCDMGDGVQRWDYNNNKFEEMDESEKKKYWTYY